MNAEEFKTIISTQGMYKVGEFNVYTINEGNKSYIFKTYDTSFRRDTTLKLMGIYLKDKNLLINANSLVEYYTKEYKRDIRAKKKEGTFDFEAEKESIKPICRFYKFSMVTDTIEDMVNERVTKYISEKYDKTDIKHKEFSSKESKALKELAKKEDIKRFMVTGAKEVPYTSRYHFYGCASYNTVEEFADNEEEYINKEYKKYIEKNEKTEHLYLVAAHQEDLAVKALLAKKNHPVHLKRQLDYSISNQHKNITLELSSTDKDGNNMQIEVPTEVITSANYLDGFRLMAVGYDNKREIIKKYPELRDKEIKYDDIKRVLKGKTVLFEDLYYTRP